MNLHREKGSIATILAFIVLLSLVISGLAFFVFGKIVPPNMIGIRRNYVSIPGVLKDGYEEKGLVPGLHWKAPFVSNIVLIPRDFQFIQMGREETADLSFDALEIPTTDGSFVKTDISLIVRFFDKPGSTVRTGTLDSQTQDKGESDGGNVPLVQNVTRVHGGPKSLVNTYGSENSKQLKTFTINAESNLKRYLSNLSTSGFYNPVLREKAALKATESVNMEVNQYGIELWATLMRRYVYSQKNIDDQIFAKNLQDASKKLNSAKSSLAEAQAATEKVLAQWDGQKIKVLSVQGQSDVRVLDEEAKHYEEELIARGDKLVEIAKSEVEKEKNELLTSQGGKIYTARRMLPFLLSLKGGVISNIDPYDSSSWVRKLTDNTTGVR